MNSSCFHKEIHIDSFYSFREDKGETKIKLGRERGKKEKEGGRERNVPSTRSLPDCYND